MSRACLSTSCNHATGQTSQASIRYARHRRAHCSPAIRLDISAITPKEEQCTRSPGSAIIPKEERCTRAKSFHTAAECKLSHGYHSTVKMSHGYHSRFKTSHGYHSEIKMSHGYHPEVKMPHGYHSKFLSRSF